MQRHQTAAGEGRAPSCSGAPGERRPSAHPAPGLSPGGGGGPATPRPRPRPSPGSAHQAPDPASRRPPPPRTPPPHPAPRAPRGHCPARGAPPGPAYLAARPRPPPSLGDQSRSPGPSRRHLVPTPSALRLRSASRTCDLKGAGRHPLPCRWAELDRHRHFSFKGPGRHSTLKVPGPRRRRGPGA